MNIKCKLGFHKEELFEHQNKDGYFIGCSICGHLVKIMKWEKVQPKTFQDWCNIIDKN